MQLMTKELEATIPPLYSQEDVADPIAHCKFFTPWTGWTWYVTEYRPDERLCFGLVEGQETELGYFSLDELEEVKGPFGLTIERDINFRPAPLSAFKKGA